MPPTIRLTTAWSLFVFATIAGAALPRVACAQDHFEIQVYRDDINRTGHFGLEVHGNVASRGLRTSTAPELPLAGLYHLTFEFSLGVTRWLELGAYLQFAWPPGIGPEFGGVKLRGKFRIPVPRGFPLGFGINAELSYVPSQFEGQQWGAELRPIVTWHPGRWDLAVNPILSFDLAGPHAGVPQIDPCAVVEYEVAHNLAAGLEYYGALGPVNAFEPVPAQGHYLFGVVDLVNVGAWELDLGVGAGLTPGSQPVVLKVIAGYEF